MTKKDLCQAYRVSYPTLRKMLKEAGINSGRFHNLNDNQIKILFEKYGNPKTLAA